MTLYDEVEYPSRSFSQTHPERSAAIGTLLGMSPPAPSTCRVLEVGCGSGWNLIPMAAALPFAAIFGFDLAPSAIDAARRDAASLGLTNLRLEHLDLMDFPPDSGEFDYIIAHGFYSWVPEPVRLKLLDICRAHLSPQGLAFISFNANPYGRVRRMWRDMMMYHADQMGAVNPSDRLAHSEALLKLLRDQWSKRKQLGFHARLLDHQIDSIQSGGGNWFFHDDLGPFFELFSISDFNRELQSHGLQFASEALFENLNPETLPDAAGDWIAREQTWDNMMFRGFHSALVCHADQALCRPLDLKNFEKLHYAGSITRVSDRVFRNQWTKSEAESEDPGTLEALERLMEAWPDSLGFDELRTSAAALRDLTVSNVIEPRVTERSLPRPAVAPGLNDSPIVFAPARLQARRGKVVTNRLHAAIQLGHESLRQFVIGLDGTRPVRELLPLFGNERELAEQLHWLYHAALIH